MDINKIKIVDVNHLDYIPKGVGVYVPQNNEKLIATQHLKLGKSMLAEGPHGIGKTLLFADIACEAGIPLIQFDASENTKRSDLIGRFSMVGNEVVYFLGVFPTAFELANKAGKAILVLEELNALNPNMQKILNQVTDWRNHCYVPEIYRKYKLNPGCTLMVAATMNPSFYGGTFELNQDLKSRFMTILKLGFPKENKEKEIVNTVVKDVDQEILQYLETLAIESRNGLDTSTYSYGISTRDIIQVLEAYNMYPSDLKHEAFRYGILNKFDEEQERKTMAARIESVTGWIFAL